MSRNTSSAKGESGRPYRVLMGVTGAAGQSWALSQALRKHGVHAENVLLGKSSFGYKADHIVAPTPHAMSEFLANNVDNFDIFHMHFRPMFYLNPRLLTFPSFADLPLLKAAGKRVVFHFRGSEIRFNDEFVKRSPYAYVDENPARLTSNFPDATKARYLELVRAGADAVLANDHEIAAYVGEPTEIVNRILGSEPKNPPLLPLKTRPLVVHAPSRRAVKGTDWVMEAVKELESKGLDFDFKLVEGLSHEEAMQVYREADIVIDQLRIGWYGVLSVEAMSFGKAVMCYIRDDLQHHLGNPAPMVPTRRESLVDDLRALIENPELRRDVGRRGREYYLARHSRDAVIPGLIDIYDRVWEAEPSFDAAPYFDLLAQQYLFMKDPAMAETLAALPPVEYFDGGWHPQGTIGKAAYLLETEGLGSVIRRSLGKIVPNRTGA